MKYSVVVPVYNRPEEIQELLASLKTQSEKDFEVIVVEDGSTNNCRDVVMQFSNDFPIHYFFKENEGPGPARNFGFAHAKGEYFVIFDSDCIIPPHYFSVVSQALKEKSLDAWGGPDRAHQNFTVVQRAMGYTMSAFLTTGGIRGGKKHVGWFQPRSFNMGLSRKVFESTKGFQFARFAEDIELSIRMKNSGFKVALIEEAFVYHKRRTNFTQFFKQVSNFGKGRVHIGKKYPSEIKMTHWIPALFTLGFLSVLLLPLISFTLFRIGILALAAYLSAILIHSAIVNKNLAVAFLSIPSALVQLIGYGSGFLIEKFKTIR